MAKKETEKETKKAKNVKKENTKKGKENKKKEKVNKENYFAGVKSEISKVKWPSKKEVLKYTTATIIFMVVLVLFFVLMSLIMSAIKGAFN